MEILFCIFVVIFGFVIISDIVRWGFSADTVIYNLKFLLYFVIGMTVISALGYLIYAAVMGGKYCVVFEMDEIGINHRQTENQAKRQGSSAR
jgi:hypothetical protein